MHLRGQKVGWHRRGALGITVLLRPAPHELAAGAANDEAVLQLLCSLLCRSAGDEGHKAAVTSHQHPDGGNLHPRHTHQPTTAWRGGGGGGGGGLQSRFHVQQSFMSICCTDDMPSCTLDMVRAGALPHVG